MDYLISYPRSGNTWLRYCIEYIFKRPTIGYTTPGSSSFDKKSIGNFADIKTTGDEPIMIKRHSFEDGCCEENDKIIVLIRNFQEVIIRHTQKTDIGSFISNLSGKENEVDYYSILKQYDNWKGDKILIYYEDLISNLESTLHSVCDFLAGNKKEEAVDEIIKNLEHHKEKSIKVYSIHGQSETLKIYVPNCIENT